MRLDLQKQERDSGLLFIICTNRNIEIEINQLPAGTLSTFLHAGAKEEKTERKYIRKLPALFCAVTFQK